ncbi:MAG: hypothetical protein C4331_19125, partial [Meiothermus sp.]
TLAWWRIFAERRDAPLSPSEARGKVEGWMLVVYASKTGNTLRFVNSFLAVMHLAWDLCTWGT